MFVSSITNPTMHLANLDQYLVDWTAIL